MVVTKLKGFLRRCGVTGETDVLLVLLFKLELNLAARCWRRSELPSSSLFSPNSE
jgi:hypothetical protein